MSKKGESGKTNKYIRWFSDLGKENISLVGGKGANLGEMYNLGIPVPPGFCITTEAYTHFLEDTGLGDEIYKILNRLEIEKTQELEEASQKIKKMVISAEMPKDLEKEILENYQSMNLDPETLRNASSTALTILKRGYEPIFVAVRSSATAEDTGAASFAGQQESFLNVKGNTEIIHAVKECWASLFTARSIYYRVKKKFKHEVMLISVVVQAMVNSDKSGVVFSKDPVSDSGDIVIEAVYGLGEGIVSGRISPDHYQVSSDLKVKDKKLSEKKIAISRNSSGKNEIFNLTEERSKSEVLNEQEIKTLAKYALELEKHYNSPQDIEFAIDSNKVFIVQTRPITTLGMKKDRQEIKGKEILKGQGASPGIGSGEVKIVRSIEELEKIKKGDVLVTKMTNPDMVVAMQKSSAIVTDEGGLTCHAAIISREMGIPAVIGTQTATKVLKDLQIVTVDGFAGKVFLGKQETVEAEIKQVVKTETKIKTIVDLPDFAPRASKTGIKAVGLVRVEGIIAESGKHPLFFYKDNKMSDYEKIIFQGISKIAEYFEELWVRTSDIRSDEYQHLQGAPKEPEVNPMLGMHGIRFSLKKPEILKAELLALKKVADSGKEIGVMMPQIISVEEVQETKKILQEIGFNSAKLGVMIETPAAVQIIDELCGQGIKFISFGTNDLTQYTLAVDRGNEECQYLYNELHPSVLKQLAYVIRRCKKYGVESSICGQAGSNKDMVEFLVKQGIDSISVNADKAFEISTLVHEMEQKGLRGSESNLGDMAKKKKEGKGKIEDVDNLDKVKEDIKEKREEVEEEKEEKREEKEEREKNIEVEEKDKEEIKKEEKEEKSEDKEKKKEEFPDVNIGIDIFSQH